MQIPNEFCEWKKGFVEVEISWLFNFGWNTLFLLLDFEEKDGFNWFNQFIL